MQANFSYSVFCLLPSEFCLQVQLPRMDSNHDKEYQKLLCYRYTTG
jgi:hypothetical protein